MKNMDLGGNEYNTTLTRNPERPNMAPCVYLSDEQVKALGLASVRVGDKFVLHANVSVYSVNSHEDEDTKEKKVGGIDVSVSLRLNEAEVEREAPSAAGALYGK